MSGPSERTPLRRRVAEYLGLTETPEKPPGFEAGATYNGVPVFSLSDVSAIALSGNGRVTVRREDANRIPALVAARLRIQATITAMPLVQRRADGTTVRNTWLTQLNPARPNVNEMADTIADMFYDRHAYWRVLKRGPGAGGPGTGFPTASEWVSQGRVQVDPNGDIRLDGSRTTTGEILQFEGVHAGVLHEGATGAINDALRLARTAAMFTNSPFPLGYFQQREGTVEMDPDESRELLAQWSAVRRRSGWGLIPSDVELKFPEVNPATLQLAESRDATTADIARGTSSNFEDLGLNVTSRTYFNGTQVRKDQLDFQIAQYSEPIAQRLSMPDCTPLGSVVKFSTDEFLSVDELTRAQITALQLESGVLADEDEARARAGKPPLTDEQKAARATRAAQRAPIAPAQTTGPETAPGSNGKGNK